MAGIRPLQGKQVRHLHRSGPYFRLLAVLAVFVAAGCSSRPSGYKIVRPTVINQSQEEVPEEQLLDVGVTIATPRELSEKQATRLGTNADIRKSEANFIPYHMKNTLQSSGHWGAVWVVPPEDDGVDLTIGSEIVGSNGELLQVAVDAVDSTGRVWLTGKYHAEVSPEHYDSSSASGEEIFQDLYNTVANEISAFKGTLSPNELEHIRTVSRMQDAVELSPDPYSDYLARGQDGTIELQRLPSDDDPHMQRVELIREREAMFRDTLDQYYEGFYINMQEAYDNWRQYNLVEIEAMREVKREAFLQTLAGVLMIAGAVALGSSGDSSLADFGSGALVIVGGQVLINGINVSQQTAIHSEAIAELSESFGAEMRPMVIELEGKQYELTGTVSEQYLEWQNLLRRIYFEETGFDPDVERFDENAEAPAMAPPGL